MVLTSSASIPGTLWYHDKPGLPAHFTTSADQPPQTTVLSTRVLNTVNHHFCSNDSTKPVRTQSLVLFFFPSPSFKQCHLSSVFTPILAGGTKLSRRMMKKGADQSWTYPAAKHRSTDYDTFLSRSSSWGPHIPASLLWESEHLNWDIQQPLEHIYTLWKICPSFPHVELGKGNKTDMLHVQRKYIMLVCTSGRF